MKTTMLMLLIVVVSAASAAPQLDSNVNQITPYSFAYGVNAHDTGDIKEHKETVTTQGVTEGEYRWLQPNGLYRVTRYTADSTGYRAIVTEEPGENNPTYYRNNLEQTSSDIFSSQGNQHSFNSAQTENQEGSGPQSRLDFQSRTQDLSLKSNKQGSNTFQSENQGSNTFLSSNQGSNTFQSRNQDSNTFQSRNQNSNSFQSRNQAFNNFQSSNERFNNFQSGNRASNNQRNFQNQAFQSAPNFQNQDFRNFQTRQNSQPQSFSSGQRFQNQGFSTSQTFQNQGNNNEGRIISEGIIKSTSDRNFDSQFNRNDNVRSNTRNLDSNRNRFDLDSNRNRFDTPRFSDSNINRGVAVVLSSNTNRFSN